MKMHRLIIFVLAALLSAAAGQITVQNSMKSAGERQGLRNPAGTGRAKAISYRSLLSCVTTFNAECLLDKTEDIIYSYYKNLWVEADEQAITTGRATAENPPSELMENISKIISELSEIFSHGISGLFRDAKDEETNNGEGDTSIKEQDEENNEEEEEESQSRGVYGEARGKKKKKKKAIKKLLVLGAVLAAKLSLLLKFLAFKVQLKFLAIAAISLVINAARFFFDLKKGHQPQKVVYYEHAQHQHHYDGEEDWSGGGGHWDRSFLNKDEKNPAQDMAYAKQKPYGTSYSVVDNKPNYSWNEK